MVQPTFSFQERDLGDREKKQVRGRATWPEPRSLVEAVAPAHLLNRLAFDA